MLLPFFLKTTKVGNCPWKCIVGIGCCPHLEESLQPLPLPVFSKFLKLICPQLNHDSWTLVAHVLIIFYFVHPCPSKYFYSQISHTSCTVLLINWCNLICSTLLKNIIFRTFVIGLKWSKRQLRYSIVKFKS